MFTRSSKATKCCSTLPSLSRPSRYTINTLNFSKGNDYFSNIFLLLHNAVTITVDHDDLLYLVYERVRVSEDSLAPHLWTYRARITLEHLSQTLQQQSNTAKYPILLEFLKEVPHPI